MQGKILTHSMAAGSHDIYVTTDDINSPLHCDRASFQAATLF
jgi:hypothetical protein